MNVYALGIESLAVRQCKQFFKHFAARFGSARAPGHTEVIATTRYFDIESAFNLFEMLVKLAAKVGQTLIVGGLENDVP